MAGPHLNRLGRKAGPHLTERGEHSMIDLTPAPADIATNDRLTAIRIMLDIAHQACQRIATGAELYARKQRERVERCERLAQSLRKPEVTP
jgi:hypothetical protein